jgi:hypothetical protein
VGSSLRFSVAPILVAGIVACTGESGVRITGRIEPPSGATNVRCTADLLLEKDNRRVASNEILSRTDGTYLESFRLPRGAQNYFLEVGCQGFADRVRSGPHELGGSLEHYDTPLDLGTLSLKKESK